jgi:hypothetical protein
VTLTDRIVASTLAGMQSHGHEPSAQAIESYRATAKFIQAMADGSADPVLAVATGPTGSGKTEEVAAAVRELLRDPAYRNVGILVLVSTLRQIVPLIERMELKPHQYAVKVGTDPENDELNGMGLVGLARSRKEADDAHHWAQVMFTTQAKLKYLTTEYGRSYRENPFFMYQGQPRRVVLWDEAFLPIDPIVITLDDIRLFAFKLAALGHAEAAKVLRVWADNIDDKQPAWDTVPAWALHLRWDDELNTKLREGSDHEADVAEAMWVLNAKDVRVELEDHKKHSKVAAISYRHTVPHDIEPLLVFDADGDQKMHYHLTHKWQGKVLFLPKIEKTYSNMTIRHMDRASGQIVYRSKTQIEALGEIAAETIREYEGEKVLIVTRLGKKAPATTLRPLIEGKVRALGGNPELLRFITWGQHKATNDYQDIKHVIIIGVHQAPLPTIIGLVHGTLKIPMTAKVRSIDVELMRMSEIRSDLLQAIGRGASRNMVNGDVPPGCTVDIIASSKGPMGFTNAKAELRQMFPSATVVPWEPKGKANGKEHIGVEAAMQLLGQGEAITVTGAQWADKAGYKNPRTVRRWMNEGSLVKELTAQGITLEALAGKGGGYRLAKRTSSYKGT